MFQPLETPRKAAASVTPKYGYNASVSRVASVVARCAPAFVLFANRCRAVALTIVFADLSRASLERRVEVSDESGASNVSAKCAREALVR